MAYRKTTEEFIKDAIKVHGNKYDYSSTHYVNSKTPVKIICLIEGLCEQRPDHHLEGKKCRSVNKKNKKLYYSNNIPIYTTYAPQLKPYGTECREYKEDTIILEVKCHYCGRWHIPFATRVDRKIQSLKTLNTGERNLYCSDICRDICPTYKTIGSLSNNARLFREVQSQLRKLVLERDSWTCQICETIDSELHCHHITPVSVNPIESADVDNCITLCKSCHKKVHTLPNCGYYELRCK